MPLMPPIGGMIRDKLTLIITSLNNKVDKETGKGLSTHDFTTILRDKLIAAQTTNKGHFATESALTTAHPSPDVGSFAFVESTDTIWAWDNDASQWVNTGSNSSGDMLAATYDPQGISGDAFSMGDMVETATAKVMTDVERTQLADLGTSTEFNTELNNGLTAIV